MRKYMYPLFSSLAFFCERYNIKSDFIENPETLKIKEISELTYFSVPEQLEQKNKKDE